MSTMYKCLLIPIARNASASMAGVISQSRTNYRASELREKLGEEDWKRRFKFAFVRHPNDRFLSAMSSAINSMNAYGSLRRPTPEEMIGYNKLTTMTQSDYLDEEIDFIGRYERINQDWKKVIKRIGIPDKLIVTNKTQNRVTKLTKEEEEFVREYYKEDFKRFNYQ